MPFGEYKDFDECVRKNSDKQDPKAYCAKIQRAVEEDAQVAHQHRITELVNISESEFEVEEADGKKRLMATVRILKSGLSKNNRNYRAKALQEAVETKKFDGMRMFINHDPSKVPMKRPMQEMVSAIESTSYNVAEEAIDARVEFFDEKFYDFAQRAKRYMGDSINALVRGSRQSLSNGAVQEDIQEIVQPRSVDWVVYPAAGGEILAFESEHSEEGEDVDWDKLTLDEVKKNAPHLVSEMEAEFKPPSGTGPEKEPDDDDEEEALPKSRVALESIIQESIRSYATEQDSLAKKREDTGKKIRTKMETSGLPERTRARVIASFEGMTDFDDKKVQAAIDDAKEELKAVGAGPRISGNGPSKGSAAGPVDQKQYSVRESVEAHFGIKKEKPATDSDDSKES